MVSFLKQTRELLKDTLLWIRIVTKLFIVVNLTYDLFFPSGSQAFYLLGIMEWKIIVLFFTKILEFLDLIPYRIARLEQEIENSEKKLAIYIRENGNLQEELFKAYNIILELKLYYLFNITCMIF